VNSKFEGGTSNGCRCGSRQLVGQLYSCITVQLWKEPNRGTHRKKQLRRVKKGKQLSVHENVANGGHPKKKICQGLAANHGKGCDSNKKGREKKTDSGALESATRGHH